MRHVFLSLVILFASGPVRLIGHQDAVMSFDIRLAETQQAGGLTEAIRPDGRRIYMHGVPLATAADVIRAQVVANGGTFSVGITLRPDAGRRLAEATSTHIGRPLAILVNGVVVAAPTVRGAIGDRALITGDFTQADAERIASSLSR